MAYANSTPIMKKKRFKPTKAAGNLSDKKREKLKKVAPETLVRPTTFMFNSQKSYEEALRKFYKHGNWASNK